MSVGERDSGIFKMGLKMMKSRKYTTYVLEFSLIPRVATQRIAL